MSTEAIQIIKTKQNKTSKNRIQKSTNPNVAWYKLISDHYTPSKINLIKKNKVISVKKKKENNTEEIMSNAKLAKIAYLRPHLLVVTQKQ